MDTVDELYLARMEAESAEQDAWERLQRDPTDIRLITRHRAAEALAKNAGAAYLDALQAEQVELQRRHLVAV